MFKIIIITPISSFIGLGASMYIYNYFQVGSWKIFSVLANYFLLSSSKDTKGKLVPVSTTLLHNILRTESKGFRFYYLQCFLPNHPLFFLCTVQIRNPFKDMLHLSYLQKPWEYSTRHKYFWKTLYCIKIRWTVLNMNTDWKSIN